MAMKIYGGPDVHMLDTHKLGAARRRRRKALTCATYVRTNRAAAALAKRSVRLSVVKPPSNPAMMAMDAIRIHDPISISVNHAMVAQLLHGARRERGFYGGLYSSLAAGRLRMADLRRARRAHARYA
jgi:hypothetical protein